MPAHDPFAPSSGAKLDSDDASAPVSPEPEPEVEAEQAPAEPEVEEVPKGTVKELEDWVGEDKERAQAVLDSENANDEPRKSLVRAMEAILDAE